MHLLALIVEKFMDLWNEMFSPHVFLFLLDFFNYLKN